MEPDAADARMVRQVLALEQIRQLSGGAMRGHTVVEVQDIDNLALVQIAGKGAVEAVATRDMVGRLILLASRSPLIAAVLDELIGFEGCEFYLREWPALAGRPFGELRFAFPAAVPVGLKRAECGTVVLNTPDDAVVAPGDQVIVLAEDDDSYSPAAAPRAEYAGHFEPGEQADRDEEADGIPEKMLFCGWRRDMADMISELDEDVPPGSELWLFNEVPVAERAAKLLDKGNKLRLRLRNLTMRHVVGNPLMRRELASLAEAAESGDEGDGGGGELEGVADAPAEGAGGGGGETDESGPAAEEGGGCAGAGWPRLDWTASDCADAGGGHETPAQTTSNAGCIRLKMTWMRYVALSK